MSHHETPETVINSFKSELNRNFTKTVAREVERDASEESQGVYTIARDGRPSRVCLYPKSEKVYSYPLFHFLDIELSGGHILIHTAVGEILIEGRNLVPLFEDLDRDKVRAIRTSTMDEKKQQNGIYIESITITRKED